VQITKLRIDSQMYYLDSGQDIPRLKTEIVAAATAGAAFLDFTAVGHGEVSVLMTPRLSARFEVQEHTDQEVAEWEENPPIIDMGTFDHY
jgi:hypothetical protein